MGLAGKDVTLLDLASRAEIVKDFSMLTECSHINAVGIPGCC